ncbi:MAG: alpha amylase C-terminal domain-containing protein [Rhodothermales bacterium]|nr:alpha amylase C-terminal domain-containing protein [Rhodothermales bacterium]MBO6778079.1 alpha amylase C-terminal domain-containing protein [Rhodothermales bacterium]
MKRVLLLVVLLAGCSGGPGETAPTALDKTPSWSHEAVWYQIFVERFRNGDPFNDPTAADIVGSYPGFIPDSWAVTPWSWDWYRPDPWFEEMRGREAWDGSTVESFGQFAQLRRYGGDLQGVLDQLDHIEALGINAVYFNPLNDAASLHKFDARNWRHMDRNFGPTPDEDAAIMAAEDPTDPATWQWTGADRMFLDLLDELHARDIRVILDFSWNHTGNQFWAFKDVRENGAASEYADWYWIDAYDDPTTPEDEFAYKGWFGVVSLPEIRETIYHDPSIRIEAYEADIHAQAVKDHIFAVSRRWLDPNGDGDPSDGVDGFRLDVAAEIGLEFWREYREVVRGVNPEAYLLGEVWWEKWPDDLLDPAPFLQGDVFDAVMNYRWYRSARRFFAEAPDRMPVSEFVDSLRSYNEGYPDRHQYAMMNMSASHDAPRVSTSLYNPKQYKVNVNAVGDPSYRIDQPDAETWETLDLLMAHQFTYIGAPQIWAGDEMGMWGADDPSSRKPLVWPDLEYDDETAHPLGLDRPKNTVQFDQARFERYQQFVEIRRSNPVLSHGGLEYLVIDDEARVLAFRRFNETGDEVIAVFNASREDANVGFQATSGDWEDVLDGYSVSGTRGSLDVSLPARRAAILVRR